MDKPTTKEETLVQNHPIYFFEDGSLVLDVEIHRFKVHHTILSRHSKFFSALDTQKENLITTTYGNMQPEPDKINHDVTRHIVLQPKLNVKAKDVEALLQHLYHDAPLGSDTPASHVMSLLLVSSPQQLDFPIIHNRALDLFENMFPKDPDNFTHEHPLYDALPIANGLKIHSVRKAILYSLITTTDFNIDDTSSSLPNHAPISIDQNQSSSQSSLELYTSFPAPASVEPPLNAAKNLSPTDAQTCMTLMMRIIEHFTPILFTPAATKHMECTDVFAETWMPLVIQPAIEDDGVYKPLETLQRIKEIDWAKHGLCTSCIVDKRVEWAEEQRIVWDSMDRWLALSDPQS